MDGKIIKLLTPVEGFDKPITEISLREPKGALFARLGKPRIPVVMTGGGSGYWVDREDVISAYLDALIEPKDVAAVVLQQLSLADMLRVREALFGFFQEAETKSVSMP